MALLFLQSTWNHYWSERRRATESEGNGLGQVMKKADTGGKEDVKDGTIRKGSALTSVWARVYS